VGPQIFLIVNIFLNDFVYFLLIEFKMCLANKAKGKKQYDSGTPKKRKCGNCGEEGHNRKNCPNE
jgi:hypothetical protein